jgi:histidine ammonia-lyase
MIAQVTAAALVSENKMLAHPASVDSIPTSANQEDHVSMACHGARRLAVVADNCLTVIALEWLAAAQGVDFLKPHRPASKLATALDRLRTHVATMPEDRFLAPDIEKARQLLLAGALDDLVPASLTESRGETQ